MKIQHLRYIVMIADQRSISLAAKKLYVSQPYLSKIVQDIEADFGKKIFERKPQGIALTAEGKQLYFLAQSVISQMDAIENIGKQKIFPKTKVKLGVSIAGFLLKDSIMLAFIKKVDAALIDINLNETTVEEAINLVDQNKSELALVVVDDYQLELLTQLKKKHGISIISLDKGSLYYHFHKDHPLASQKQISIQALANYPFAQFKEDVYTKISRQKFIEEYPDFKVAQKITINNYHAFLRIVKNNGALMVGNKWEIEELEKMGLQSLKIEDVGLQVHMLLIVKKDQELSSNAKIFLEIFKELYNV